MSKNPRKISLIGSRATSILSVTLVLIVIGLCATLGLAVHRATLAVGEGTTIFVTLEPSETTLRASELKRQFNHAPWVANYEFFDKTTVLSREVDHMSAEAREALELLSDNPFGDEFVLHIAEGWRSTDSIAALTSRLENTQGVDIVSGDASALGEANKGINRVILYLIVLAVILLLISVALINNTISLSIYSRRFTIHTMKLVGATNSFIRRPFVRAGMLTGIVAGVLAMFVVCAVQSYLMVSDTLIGPWITPEGIGITAVGLVVLGALIARAAAWYAAKIYLRKSYDRLFKK